VATLEDWFNPARLRDDYVPTGFIGHQVTHRAVKGHEFGLDLSDRDRQALIAFDQGGKKEAAGGCGRRWDLNFLWQVLSLGRATKMTKSEENPMNHDVVD
jgi:hypothetical protein